MLLISDTSPPLLLTANSPSNPLPVLLAAPEVRSRACLLVKNNLAAVQPQVVGLLRDTVPPLLADENKLMRNSAAMLISAVAERFSLQEWPQLIPSLLHMIVSAEGSGQEVRCFCPKRASTPPPLHSMF